MIENLPQICSLAVAVIPVGLVYIKFKQHVQLSNMGIRIPGVHDSFLDKQKKTARLSRGGLYQVLFEHPTRARHNGMRVSHKNGSSATISVDGADGRIELSYERQQAELPDNLGTVEFNPFEE